MDNLKEKAEALRVLCGTLFGTAITPTAFRVTHWVECFPMEVILYALVEATLKQRRTEGMTYVQIASFAETVMLRRLQEEFRKRKAA